MIYLKENEVGFDIDKMGYPSIDGCHAVALITDVGIWGLHNYGGSATDQFPVRSKTLATFVKQHFVKPGAMHALVGVCFRNKRGYSATDKNKAWKDEIKAFAKELGFKGQVIGYNLDNRAPWPTKHGSTEADSAYVEIRRANNQVTIHFKPWSEMTDSDANKKTPTETSYKANHMVWDGKGGVKAITGKIYSDIPVKSGAPIRNAATNDLEKFTV